MDTLIIGNNYSYFKTESGEINKILWESLRFRERGYYHTSLYKQKRWDGYRDFYSKKTGRFLTGLLPEVKLALSKLNVEYKINDKRDTFEFAKNEIDENLLNYGDNPVVLYDYQVDLINQALKYKRGLIQAPTGCHAKGQKILMYDGTVKNVEDVKINDELMGMDSTKRIVHSLYSGVGNMYKIKPIKGEAFIVNEDHVLTLVSTTSHKNRFPCDKGGEITDVRVADYLKWPNWKKHINKLFKVPVEFNHKNPLPIDPYILGAILGDGSFLHSSNVKNEDSNTIKEFSSYTKSLKMKSDNKFIPHVYKTSPKHSRLQILAGLLDACGSFSKNCYNFVSKSKTLSEDLAFISRSLGLRATLTKTKKTSQNDTPGLYWRVSISGNTDIIPFKVKYKKSQPRRQKKDVLRTDFSIEYIGKGDYYGFGVDKDNRYLLDDFTVTHNSGKTNVLVGILKCLPKNLPTLILSKAINLTEQNYDEISKWGLPVGRFYGAKKDPNYITCATVQSSNKLEPILPKIKCVIVDEVHEGMSSQFVSIYRKLKNASSKFGISATPFKFGGKDKVQMYKTKGWFGGVFKIESAPDKVLKTKYLQERKKLSPSICTFYPITKPDIPYDIYMDAVTRGIAESPYFDNIVLSLIEEIKGRTLLLVERVSHGEKLNELIDDSIWISGKDDMKIRKPVLDKLKSEKNNLIVIATRHILNTGINIMIHNLINCAGGKADHDIVQRIGRGLRNADDKEKLRYYDFFFKINPYLESHSKHRVKLFKQEGHEVIIKDKIDFKC